MSDSFGSRVREKRKQLHLTQVDLGEKAGIAQSRISTIEAGNAKDISLDEAAKIADKLGVSIEWLYKGDESARPITPLQWFLFTRELINNPPRYVGFGGFTTVRYDEKKIVFCGDDMDKFFSTYNALCSSGLDEVIQNKMVIDLFNHFQNFFTPGYQHGEAINDEVKEK